MRLVTRVGLVIGTAWLLLSSAAAEARQAGFAFSPHVMAPPPHFASGARRRIDRSIGFNHFALQRPELRADRQIRRTQRRFANRFAAPFWGFSPDIWSDEEGAPNAPEVPGYDQHTDAGSGSEGSPEPPAGASDMGNTVIRRDYPGYTVLDYCRIPPRNLNDCGPEWIVMHPITAAPAMPVGTQK